MPDVTMPQLGESVTEGTITRWFKQPGDEVAEDEVLLEVSTDKVDTEVPSPIAGTVQELRADEGDTVDVGTVIAVVGAGAAPSESGGDAGDGADGVRQGFPHHHAALGLALQAGHFDIGAGHDGQDRRAGVAGHMG